MHLYKMKEHHLSILKAIPRIEICNFCRIIGELGRKASVCATDINLEKSTCFRCDGCTISDRSSPLFDIRKKLERLEVYCTRNSVKPLLLDARGAAEFLCMKESMIRDLTFRKQIPFVKFGTARKSAVRYNVNELSVWVNEHKVFCPQGNGKEKDNVRYYP